MTDYKLNLVENYNRLYEEKGFDAVINKVAWQMQQYGTIRISKGVVTIITGGYSYNEEIIHSLIHSSSIFGNKHYIGYMRGGAYYFAEKADELNYEIVPYLSDAESCNPNECGYWRNKKNE